MNRIDVAIDLLWLKVNNIGGGEVVIRTLLDNFANIAHNYRFVLFVTKDNAYSFKKYENMEVFKIVECDTKTVPIVKRLLWQNTKLPKLLKSMNIKYYFCSVYIRPIVKLKNIKSVLIVNDLQQLHYPEYFSKPRYLWCKYSWKRNIKISDYVVTISEFCKKDIMKYYKTPEDKLKVIYVPISDKSNIEDFEKIAPKYNIEAGQYFYTVLSPLKHKNLITVLKMMNKIVKENTPAVPKKLLISGISGSGNEEFIKYIKDNSLEENCIITGFVSDEERNSLMKNASLFLFPSIFEGFGMPVVESLKIGTNVVTTKCASIPEVSLGKAAYIDNPYDEAEWLNVVNSQLGKKVQYDFEEYDERKISNDFMELFDEVYK